MTPRVEVLPTADEVADAVARRLLDALVEAQQGGGTVHLCLTGGTIATTVYGRLAGLVPGSGLDAARLELWWGDERFVAADSSDRNARQALDALAGCLDGATVHPIGSSDDFHTPDEAARAYAEKLAGQRFDIELLGVGPDGHCLSVFPDHPSFVAARQPVDVIGVEDAPKPPPTRVSLTFTAASRTKRLWVVVTGQEKADVVARALAGDDALPSAHPRGEQETVWFLDEAAASRR